VRFPLPRDTHAGGPLSNDVIGWTGDPHLSRDGRCQPEAATDRRMAGQTAGTQSWPSLGRFAWLGGYWCWPQSFSTAAAGQPDDRRGMDVRRRWRHPGRDWRVLSIGPTRPATRGLAVSMPHRARDRRCRTEPAKVAASRVHRPWRIRSGHRDTHRLFLGSHRYSQRRAVGSGGAGRSRLRRRCGSRRPWWQRWL